MSAYGMTVTVLATQLAEAVLKDESSEEGGFDLSAGLFGRNVSDWIRETAKELNEQARLLGMSAERELKLIAEIERLRAEITTREDGAEKMALKGIEMRNEIQRLINERNAFGLAIDRALSGIVPDEHPLRSRLVEIAAMRAEIEAMRVQEPVGTAFLCDRCKTPFDGEHYCPACNYHMATETPVYLAPGAQTAPSVPDGWKLVPVEPTHETLISIAHHVAAPVTYSECKAIYRAVVATTGAQENNDAPQR